MVRKNISSGSQYEKPIGFSRAVRIKNIISVSGTAPIALNGSTACPNDLYGQTKHCLEIIKKAIEDAGGKLTSVIRFLYFESIRQVNFLDINSFKLEWKGKFRV